MFPGFRWSRCHGVGWKRNGFEYRCESHVRRLANCWCRRFIFLACRATESICHGNDTIEISSVQSYYRSIPQYWCRVSLVLYECGRQPSLRLRRRPIDWMGIRSCHADNSHSRHLCRVLDGIRHMCLYHLRAILWSSEGCSHGSQSNLHDTATLYSILCLSAVGRNAGACWRCWSGLDCIGRLFCFQSR